MGRGDVPEVAAMEQTSPSPWLVASLLAEFDRPHGLQLVATGDDGDGLSGWCCGQCFDGEAELFKITVAPHCRRRGIGTSLLLGFEELCREDGCVSVFLEVRAGNAAALSLYSKLGYRMVGRRKKYYIAPQDDAVILGKSPLGQM